MKPGISATVPEVITTTDAFKAFVEDLVNQSVLQLGERPTICFYSTKIQSLIPEALKTDTIKFRMVPAGLLSHRQIWLGGKKST